MSSKSYASLAALALMAAIYLMILTDRPGTQIFAAIGSGVAALAVVRLTMAAVLAELAERQERAGVRQ